MALLLYTARRHGAALGYFSCWRFCGCPPERRDRCVAYRSRQGYLCWFLTGTLCQGKRLRDWQQKRAVCGECRFFQCLMAPPPSKMHVARGLIASFLPRLPPRFLGPRPAVLLPAPRRGTTPAQKICGGQEESWLPETNYTKKIPSIHGPRRDTPVTGLPRNQAVVSR